MDILKSCILSVCFAAVAVGIIEALLPSGSFKRQMRLLTGALLIISLLTPLKLMQNISLPDFSASAGEYSPNEQLQSAAAASAKEQLSAILRQYEIDTAKITVYTNIGTDNCIELTKAVVAVESSDIDKASRAAKAAESAMGITVEIEELA
ncbi:MAG: stage III sporulation protein AF [Acutalibacteraceae bacterium]